ncbi:MAG: hypothetical protein K6E73_10960 [Bacteroidales bacterium]|nr:hypothetical protein [Bacteroidales bacterium]
MKKTTLAIAATSAIIAASAIGIVQCHRPTPKSAPLPIHIDYDSILIIQGDSIFKEAVICYESHKKRNSSAFTYENMTFQDKRLTPFLLEKKSASEPFIKLPNGDILLNSVKIKDKIPYETTQVFIRLYPVDGWVDDVYEDCKGAFLRMRAYDTCFYYCGQINLSKKFDSFVFINNSSGKEKHTDDEYIKKDLYIINLSDSVITSVSKMYSYTNSYQTFYLHTYRISANKFRNYYCFSHNCDSIAEEEPQGEIFFSFDNQGRIVIK